MHVAKTIIVVLAASLASFCQVPKRLQFDVAAISLSQKWDRLIQPLPGGRFRAVAPLRMLIEKAFGVSPPQITGGPDWLKTDSYKIDATAGGNPSNEDLFAMLRSLLEDRFKLETHRETKELPIYSLLPAKGGIKLPPPKEANCWEPDAPASAQGPLPRFFRCGDVLYGVAPNQGIVKGGNVVMAQLARALSLALNRPVIDKTGYTGVFDVELSFAPIMPDSDDAPSALPSIFLAIQETLGLKLEPSKGPVEMLVVDHVERPSGN